MKEFDTSAVYKLFYFIEMFSKQCDIVKEWNKRMIGWKNVYEHVCLFYFCNNSLNDQV